jgi:hypothetical protein
VAKKQEKEEMFGSPVFVATFADGEVTRMTVFCAPDNLDVERGMKLAQCAYESRAKKVPPAFTKARFEQAGTGTVIKTYSAVELVGGMTSSATTSATTSATAISRRAQTRGE